MPESNDVYGMPPEFVAELLAEGAETQGTLTDTLRDVNRELRTDGVPSDDSLERLTKIRTRLEDANSSFEMTRSFLEKRGLTNVRELDAQGKKELKEHLELVLKAVKARNTPA